MSTVHTVVFSPEPGDEVDLPETIGRVAADRLGSPDYGVAPLKVGIVGQGDMIPYVVHKTDAESADLVDGAQVLVVDVASESTWYAIPRSHYGGGED